MFAFIVFSLSGLPFVLCCFVCCFVWVLFRLGAFDCVCIVVVIVADFIV